MKNRDVLIWLNNLPGVNNRYMESLISIYKNISDLWYESRDRIYRIEGIGEKLKESIVQKRNRGFYNNIIETLESKGVRILTIYDEEYPISLKNIPDGPKVLYTRGEFQKSDNISISIVGARKASNYGIWVAKKLTRELNREGIVVVSGMATGIDAASHRQSIEDGSRTIAVLGTGIDIIYPDKNKDIYHYIEENGVLISEFPMGSKPLPYRFPQRNRIISGLSLGTLVIEADYNSGTLITANHALDQGKEVFSVPGNINSQNSRGTNRLIQEGAKLVSCVDDIFDEIQELKDYIESIRQPNNKSLLEHRNLSKIEKKLLDIIERGQVSLELIAIELNMPVSEITSLLTILEIKGIIVKQKGNIYSMI